MHINLSWEMRALSMRICLKYLSGIKYYSVIELRHTISLL